ncbi:hypothetical protein WT26_20920 [Burkholderia cepacia]|uniref:Uncharacterized protein n=2 Tax=Burkholderia cepacia complex TaxID=87882 RepID=A0A1B4PXK0_BURCE|nr:hypothetical protein WT26_20920 [Burkholderia cepacia]AOK25268.1 hypothetical protein WK67_20850 [Burkholderia ubonensis]
MSQQVRDLFERHAGLLQPRCCRTPKHMRTAELIRQAAACKRTIHCITDGRYAEGDTKGRTVAHEYGATIGSGATFPKITSKGFAGLYRQGQMLRALALGAMKRHNPVSPIHAVQRQVSGFISPQAEIEYAAGDGIVS